MTNDVSRRAFLQMASAGTAALALLPKPLGAVDLPGSPVVFWATEGVLPNDLVMAVGGSLAGVQEVAAWRLRDDPPATPADGLPAPPNTATTLKTIQANDRSFKVQLPHDWKPGVFAMRPRGGQTLLLNRPLLWFIQPTKLLPGLSDNEVAPGTEVQVVGKDLLLPDGSGSSLIAIRAAGDRWQTFPATSADRYSILAKLPATLAPGAYELALHNGCGGAASWSAPLAFHVKQPENWPQRQWNVREHGLRGDGITDDTDALRAMLADVENNGGGIVYFPWGTYRLSKTIVIPRRVVLRGEQRDATILMWPEPMATKVADFAKAAIYTSSQFGIEDLTIIARNFDTTLLDLSNENTHPRSVDPEVLRYYRPWSQYRDIFLRRVRFQQWLDAGRPPITEDMALDKKFYLTDQCFNIRIVRCSNIEVSDCAFQGGSNMFMNVTNSRVTGNSFSNDMNYCWTVLGGGARRLVCTGNDLRASSSFGFGSIGLQYVYAAHNKTSNFVRGEREGMTLDVSSMPGLRAAAEYWGSPVAITNEPGNVTLTFPPPDAPANEDGFRTGFLPGSFRGGLAVLRAYDGGPGGGQTRHIVDNGAHTVTLDHPWQTPPDTTPRPLYLELQPRKSESAGTNAWVGDIVSAGPASLTAKPALNWIPGEFIGSTVLIFTGKGAGQYRIITANTETELTLDRAWDVMPERGEAIGVWAMTRHFIFYKCDGVDTSDFGQLYGSGYDYIMDSCHIERSQGNWAQMGWFVQMKNIESFFGYSFHKGIGPRGPSPEQTVPHGLIGLNGGQLRLTKFPQLQYPEIPTGSSIMVDQLLGRPIPGGRAIVLRRNHLMWNQRIVLGSQTDKGAPPRFIDAVIDNNLIEHSDVGVYLGAEVERVAATSNRFVDVTEPYYTHRGDSTLIL